MADTEKIEFASTRNIQSKTACKNTQVGFKIHVHCHSYQTDAEAGEAWVKIQSYFLVAQDINTDYIS